VKSFAHTAARWLSAPAVRRALQIAVAALIVLFFALALYDLWPELTSYDWQFEPVYLVLASVVLVLRGPLPAYGWYAIVRHLGHNIPFLRSIRIVYYSGMAAFLPGSVWHAVGRVYLAEREGVPRMAAAVSVALETVLILMSALMVGSLSLIAWPDPPWWAVAGGAAVLFVIVARPQIMIWAANRVLSAFGRRTIDARLSTLDVLRLMWPFALNWLVFGVMFYLIVESLYPGLGLVYLPLVTGIFTAAWVGGYLAVVVPQGWGVREFIIVTLLAAVGVPAPVATAAALLARLWSMLGVALWGLISTRL
jgi:glycosyltransferase 2 family protein